MEECVIMYAGVPDSSFVLKKGSTYTIVAKSSSNIRPKVEWLWEFFKAMPSTLKVSSIDRKIFSTDFNVVLVPQRDLKVNSVISLFTNNIPEGYTADKINISVIDLIQGAQAESKGTILTTISAGNAVSGFMGNLKWIVIAALGIAGLFYFGGPISKMISKKGDAK